MQEQKNWLSIFLIVLVVLIVIFIGFIFAKKLTYVPPASKITPVATTTPKIVDTGGKIATQFPADLIKTTEISQIVQSYNVSTVQNKTQYTFRYISNKGLSSNSTYFKSYLSKNGWHLSTSAVDKTNFVSIVSTKNQTEKMFITINDSKSGVIVDVTYIK